MKYTDLIKILLLSLLLMNGCSETKTEEITKKRAEGLQVDYFDQRTGKMKAFLLAKKINCLDEVFGKETNANEKYLIYYITGQDCGSCIAKGFKGIMNLNPELKKRIHPVASNVNIGSLQMHYDYQTIIYPDNQDKIRKELGYFHSPMFLWYSTERGIEDVYFIPTFEDDLKMDNFFGRLN